MAPPVTGDAGGVALRVTGAQLVRRALALLGTGTRDRVMGVIRDGVRRAEQEAKSRVPVDSGELRATIRTEMSADGMTGFLQAGYGTLRRRSRSTGKRKARRRVPTLENTLPGVYAMVIEFGDPRRNRAPHPYIVPAIEAVRPIVRAAVEAAVQDAVREVGGGAT